MKLPDFSAEPRLMPPPVIHRGRRVTLHPQDPAGDAVELFAISHGGAQKEALWRYLPVGPFEDAGDLRTFLASWQSSPDVLSFTVREAGSGAAIRSISLVNLRPAHGVAELGNIWFTPAAQGTGANPEANFLLLRHCFEDLGYRRMEWKCNALNEPSRRAAQRLGFSFEGTFRQHMIVKGENRDSAWFAMMDHEWPLVKARLEEESGAPGA